MEIKMTEYTIDQKVKEYRSKIRKNEIKQWKKLVFIIGPIWLVNLIIDIYYEQNYSLIHESEKLEMMLVFGLIFGGVLISYTARMTEKVIENVASELIIHSNTSNNKDEKPNG